MLVMVMLLLIMAVVMAMVMRLMGLARALRSPVGETHGDLHRMNRTALGILDPD